MINSASLFGLLVFKKWRDPWLLLTAVHLCSRDVAVVAAAAVRVPAHGEASGRASCTLASPGLALLAAVLDRSRHNESMTHPSRCFFFFFFFFFDQALAGVKVRRRGGLSKKKFTDSLVKVSTRLWRFQSQACRHVRQPIVELHEQLSKNGLSLCGYAHARKLLRLSTAGPGVTSQ